MQTASAPQVAQAPQVALTEQARQHRCSCLQVDRLVSFQLYL